MENKPRILFFGFSDVGYKCLKLLLDKGCDVIGVFTHDTDPHEAHWFKTPESLAKENFIRVFKPTTLKTEIGILSPNKYFRSRNWERTICTGRTFRRTGAAPR